MNEPENGSRLLKWWPVIISLMSLVGGYAVLQANVKSTDKIVESHSGLLVDIDRRVTRLEAIQSSNEEIIRLQKKILNRIGTDE